MTYQDATVLQICGIDGLGRRLGMLFPIGYNPRA